VVLLGVMITLTVAATSSLAHPSDLEAPTNYTSEVTGVTGDHRGVDARVMGGDAFLRLEVPADIEVEVPGYLTPETYLRFEPGGDVYANVAGPTHHYNTDRFAAVQLPTSVRADAEPQWERVATDGRYTWRDHRIHWMNPSPPPRVDTEATASQHVLDWEVPIMVEGEPVVITGTLTWLPTPTPALPLAVALLVAAAGIARRSTTLSATAVGLAAAAMVAVAISDLAVPHDGAAPPVAEVTAALVALALAARSATRSATGRTRAWTLAAAAVGLAIAVVHHLDMLTMAVWPGWVPSVVGRPLLGTAAGAALAGLVTGLATLRSPGHDPEVVATTAGT
jgi:hypothetical protein